jgi:hypothetical protein
VRVALHPGWSPEGCRRGAEALAVRAVALDVVVLLAGPERPAARRDPVDGPFALTAWLQPVLAPRARVLWVAGPSGEDRAEVAASAREWARRLAPRGVAVHAVDPGPLAGSPAPSLPGGGLLGRRCGPSRTPGEAADTVVWLATTGTAGELAGGFWLDRQRRPLHDRLGPLLGRRRPADGFSTTALRTGTSAVVPPPAAGPRARSVS